MVVPSYQAPCGDADNKLLPEDDRARSVYRVFHTSCKDLKNGTHVKRDTRKRKVRDDEIILDTTKARLVVDAEYSCRSDKAIKVASVNQKGMAILVPRRDGKCTFGKHGGDVKGRVEQCVKEVDRLWSTKTADADVPRKAIQEKAHDSFAFGIHKEFGFSLEDVKNKPEQLLPPIQCAMARIEKVFADKEGAGAAGGDAEE